MAMYLGDINTRARGLQTRLLPTSELGRLAQARSLFTLQRNLQRLGMATTDMPATAPALEEAIRRRAGELMQILTRWATEERRPALAVVLEDESRRSIQKLLRGAEQGAPTDTRLSGLVPTADLPARALRLLAGQPTPADVVRTLVLIGHPLGQPLVGAVSGPHPSLLEIEGALQRAFATRALTDARRGGSVLLDYVHEVIDLMNLWSALLHFAEREEAGIDASFIEGGKSLERDVFTGVIQASSLHAAWRDLSRALHGSPIGRALGKEPELTSLEIRILRSQIGRMRATARVRPRSAAPLIGFSLRLRAEVWNLRRIIWGVALEAPPAVIEAAMVAS